MGQPSTDPQTGGTLLDASEVIAVSRRPRPAPPRDQFRVLQKWEGTVLAVEGDTFTATLRDLSASGRLEEEVVLPLDEVEDSDRPLVVPGGIFYWTLGYRVNLFGNRERAAALRFRRLPAWTAAELADVERKADRLRDLFG